MSTAPAVLAELHSVYLDELHHQLDRVVARIAELQTIRDDLAAKIAGIERDVTGEAQRRPAGPPRTMPLEEIGRLARAALRAGQPVMPQRPPLAPAAHNVDGNPPADLSAPGRRGPKPHHDPAEVAAVITAAVESGASVGSSLQQHFGVTDSVARHMVRYARSKGLIGRIDIGTRKRAGAPVPQPAALKYDYAEVAEVAVKAMAAGVALSTAVMERFSVTRTQAQWMVHRARALGHDVPDAPKGRVPSRLSTRMAALEADLEELERTDPAVAKAADDYDNMVAKITHRPRTTPRREPAVRAKTNRVRPASRTTDRPLKPKLPSEPIPDLTLDDDDDPVDPKAGYNAVAAAYLRLQQRDEPVQLLAALARELRCSRSTAGRWVRHCRETGLLPSREDPQIERVAPPSAVVHAKGGMSGVLV